jgi:predicted Zn-dependent protease
VFGPERFEGIANLVLQHSQADQTEVLFLATEEALTRFANSYIHQNVTRHDARVSVRAVVGQRTGVSATNDLSPEALKRATDQAITIAQMYEKDTDFRSLPGPMPVPAMDAFVQRTADCSPEERARRVGVICRLAKEKGLRASGAFSTQSGEFGVANSLGVQAYTSRTKADLNTVVMGDSGSGYATAVSANLDAIDTEALGREAVDKALRSADPIDLPPGEYEVVLEEYAVATILMYMAYMGFSSLALQEGRSFMRLGEQIVGPEVSIWDDGLDPSGLPMPFDFEGVPKQRVDLIKRGMAEAVVYDSYTAGREEGSSSTGHALPAPNQFGPIPMNLFMRAGDVPRRKMGRSIQRGLWVTRFHYTNPLHPIKAILTGMTRDGTFLIENGEITRPVRDLRFTQSALEALRGIVAISEETRLVPGWFGASRVPALHLRKFRFTGATE